MFRCLRIIAPIAAIKLNCGFALAEDAAFSANDLMAGCRAYLLNDIPTENYFGAKYRAGAADEPKHYRLPTLVPRHCRKRVGSRCLVTICVPGDADHDASRKAMLFSVNCPL
jgi:hypothetical protein